MFNHSIILAVIRTVNLTTNVDLDTTISSQIISSIYDL